MRATANFCQDHRFEMSTALQTACQKFVRVTSRKLGRYRIRCKSPLKNASLSVQTYSARQAEGRALKDLSVSSGTSRVMEKKSHYNRTVPLVIFHLRVSARFHLREIPRAAPAISRFAHSSHELCAYRRALYNRSAEINFD